ncbi:MAG TPA: hypothetical protein VEJ47_22875 [Candidatus Eremiobacteraceae bacterium]|nr:hypothetical protein [Candidatus Eremiobacteraceae bacterium]
MSKVPLTALASLVLTFAAVPGLAQTQNAQRPENSRHKADLPCAETPTGKGLRLVCPVPSLPPDEEEDTEITAAEGVRIVLRLPEGTPLRIAIDERTRISHVGEAVRGHVVDTVYAFDDAVIPSGSVVTGYVTAIVAVPKLRRAQAYANGNFSPFRNYHVTFDRLSLPDGREVPIETSVAPGVAEVVHLVSKPEKSDEEKSKTVAGRAAQAAKQEVKDGVHQANESAHQAAEQIRTPGRMHRLKEFLASQSPYRRQYLEPGTRFNASLNRELDFGSETQSEEGLAKLGNLPLADTVLHARLMLEVSSATATRGTPVVAEITQPVYAGDQSLLLPTGSRLIGQVVEAKPARRLHRNGELRVIFEHIEVPGGTVQQVQGTLEGIEVSRAAHLKLDEEGGARATDSKTRYLSTGVALLMAAVAAHPDVERGTVDPAGDPAVRAGAGASGFGLAGTIIGLAAKSSAVSILFSAYGATASIYANFLSRGREVVLPKDAPLEIGLGTRHPNATGRQH